MKQFERMLCQDCGPGKLIRAGMTWSRKPGGDDIARCAFCGQERPCKCYVIITEKTK